MRGQFFLTTPPILRVHMAVANGSKSSGSTVSDSPGSLGSKYPIPCSKPAEWGSRQLKTEAHLA